MLVKERWSGSVGSPPSVLQYVTDFNLSQAQSIMKEWYNIKATERAFQENDEVLCSVVANPGSSFGTL